jgi:hypothetical protein
MRIILKVNIKMNNFDALLGLRGATCGLAGWA